MKTIKRILLASALLFGLFPILNAQMTEGKVRFGLKLGVSGSNLYDDANADEKKSRIGFTGGAFAKIPLVKHIALRPELLFTTKGAQFDIIGGNTSDLKLSYLEIPLSLEFNLAIVNIHAGVHAGLLATAEGTFKDSQGNPITFKVDKEFNTSSSKYFNIMTRISHKIVFEFKPASYYNSNKAAIGSTAIIWLLVLGP